MDTAINFIVPAVMAAIIFYGLLKRVAVLDAFLEGAKEGLNTVAGLIPTMVGIFCAIKMFEASGALDVVISAISPLGYILRLPKEVLPLVLLRPLSGSGALAYFKTIVERYGAQSMITRLSATMMGSSETTFYTMSVYYGAAGVKKTRYTLICALFGDIVAFTCAGIFIRLFF